MALRDLFKKLRSPARAICYFLTCHGVENEASKPEAPSAPRGLGLFDLLQGGARKRILWQGFAQGVQENLQGKRPVG